MQACPLEYNLSLVCLEWGDFGEFLAEEVTVGRRFGQTQVSCHARLSQKEANALSKYATRFDGPIGAAAIAPHLRWKRNGKTVDFGAMIPGFGALSSCTTALYPYGDNILRLELEFDEQRRLMTPCKPS